MNFTKLISALAILWIVPCKLFTESLFANSDITLRIGQPLAFGTFLVMLVILTASSYAVIDQVMLGIMRIQQGQPAFAAVKEEPAEEQRTGV